MSFLTKFNFTSTNRSLHKLALLVAMYSGTQKKMSNMLSVLEAVQLFQLDKCE